MSYTNTKKDQKNVNFQNFEQNDHLYGLLMDYKKKGFYFENGQKFQHFAYLEGTII